MKKRLALFILVLAVVSCTNNATITGVNNTDTVELNDEFGRDAYPELKTDTLQKDPSRKK